MVSDEGLKQAGFECNVVHVPKVVEGRHWNPATSECAAAAARKRSELGKENKILCLISNESGRDEVGQIKFILS